MKSVVPNLSNLKPNPALAKLPLFDRKEWKRVRFGDVVENCNETCDPAEAGLERFVAMEHLEPGSLHVRSWGNVADGTTFTRRCRPGQVLFGKRRAYQRKVAVAEFEAVVSGDIYVLAPKDPQRLLPELLPFLCLSERFFQHAVGTSAGSLSPRTNWSSLASFEFDLPPLDQQRRIAEILWAVDEVITSAYNNIKALDDFAQSLLHAADLDRASIRSKTTHWPVVRLEELCSHIVDCLHSTPEVTDEGYPVIRTADVVPGRILLRNARKVSLETYEQRISRLKPEAGDVFYSREGERFGIAAPVPEDCEICLGQRMMHFRAAADVEASYLLALLNSPRIYGQVLASVIGTTSPHVNIRDIKAFSAPKPPLIEQRRIGSELTRVREARFVIESHISETSLMLTSVINSFS